MFTSLPKPIYEFITDYRLGGPLAIMIGLFLAWLFVQSIYLLRFLNKRSKILRTICLCKRKFRIVNPF